MKLYEIIDVLEKEFPANLAYEWDNVGLLIGDKNRDIKKVLLVLDVTVDAIKKAIEAGAELILSHHPIMFSPVKKITPETTDGTIIMKALENKISVYAAHTNCDVATGGINAYLAGLFELANAEDLEENGLGRIGEIKEDVSFGDFIEVVKRKLNTPCVRICGDIKHKIKRVAVGSGACADSINVAIEKNADVMITGDVKYHEMLDAEMKGICVIDAGHYPTEIVVTDIFEKALASCDVKTEKYLASDVFKYV